MRREKYDNKIKINSWQMANKKSPSFIFLCRTFSIEDVTLDVDLDRWVNECKDWIRRDEMGEGKISNMCQMEKNFDRKNLRKIMV